MLEMLRLAGRSFPALTGAQLLDLVTLNPARITMLRSVGAPLGTIAPGAAADFAVLDPGDSRVTDLRGVVTGAQTRVASAWIAGERAA